MAIRRTTQRVGIRRVDTMPCLEPAVATVLAASWCASDKEALFLVVSCLQQRLVTAGQLQSALEHLHIRRARLVRETVQEYTDGGTSMSEIAFARLCRRFGLPPPVRQRRRRDSHGRPRYVDAEFRTASGATVIVEIDGLHHLNPDNWLDDIERQNDLMLQGAYLVLRVSTWTLKYEPEVFMTRLAEVLRSS